MKASLVCSRGSTDSLRSSVGIEKIPEVSTYTYAPAYPRMFGVELVDMTVELEPHIIKAAAAIIKVASWSNGSIDNKTWDVTSIPVETPPPIQTFKNEASLSGVSSFPIYNCVSLPHFAVGLETLHTLDSPIEWSYADVDCDTKGIMRLLPKDQDPNAAPISDGHWMIGLGSAGDVILDAPENLGIFEPGDDISVHVNGGDGPLLISSTTAVTEFYARQLDADMTVYQAAPTV